MKSFFSIVLFLFFSLDSYSQETFSEIYNENDDIDYRINDAVLKDDNLVSIVSTTCDQTLCCQISIIDFDGKILESISVDNFLPSGVTSIGQTRNDSLLICSGGFSNTIRVLKMATDLSGYRIFSLTDFDSNLISNRGILCGSDNYYIYGEAFKDNDPILYASILKIDSKSDEILDSWYIKQGDIRNSCHDLQFMSDSSLIFRNEIESYDTFTSTGIVRVDTLGTILYENEFQDREHGFQKLSVSVVDDIIINSKISPWESVLTSNQQGWLSRISVENDQTVWSSLIPRYNYWPRNYKVLDLKSLPNGSTILSGTTIDQDSITSGLFPFYAKLSEDGEIEWIRVVKIKNENSISNNDYYLQRAQPIKILIKEDGSMFSLGSVLLLDDFGVLRYKMWFLSIDGNGCLEDEECSHVYLIDGERETAKIELINQNDAWYYDYYRDTIQNGNHERIHDYVKYEVSELVMWQQKLCNKITNNQGLADLYMYQDFDKIYFWNEETNKFDLTYDFDALYSYDLSFNNDCYDEVFDDVVLTLDGDHEDIYIHPSQTDFNFIQKGIIENVEGDAEVNILELVGKLNGGLTFKNFDQNCDSSILGYLRCYKKGDDEYNLSKNHFGQNYNCDSVWIETLSSNVEFQESQIEIFPNPASDVLRFSKYVSEVKIYNNIGLLVHDEEEVDEIYISHLKSGLYIIELDGQLHKHIFQD